MVGVVTIKFLSRDKILTTLFVGAPWDFWMLEVAPSTNSLLGVLLSNKDVKS